MNKYNRLNPCCAGRCSSTIEKHACNIFTNIVSILVVLDDALVQRNRDYTDYQYVTELH